MKKLKLIPVALIATLAFTGTAEAAPFLSKSSARREAKSDVRTMFYDIDHATDWSVDSCYRIRRNKVDCDYTIYSLEDGGYEVTCESTIRIRKYSDGYLGISFPVEPDCY